MSAYPTESDIRLVVHAALLSTKARRDQALRTSLDAAGRLSIFEGLNGTDADLDATLARIRVRLRNVLPTDKSDLAEKFGLTLPQSKVLLAVLNGSKSVSGILDAFFDYERRPSPSTATRWMDAAAAQIARWALRSSIPPRDSIGTEFLEAIERWATRRPRWWGSRPTARVDVEQDRLARDVPRPDAGSDSRLVDMEAFGLGQRRGVTVLLGDAGCGKTWALEAVARQLARRAGAAADDDVDECPLPLPVSCQRLAAHLPPDEVTDEALYHLFLAAADTVGVSTDELLKYARAETLRPLVLLLDGLDEVTLTAWQAASLRRLLRRPDIDALITCRPTSWHDSPLVTDARVVELTPLTNAQLRSIVLALSSSIDLANRLLQAVRGGGAGFDSVCVSPALISFAALAAGTADSVPTRRVDLLRHMIPTLIKAPWREPARAREAYVTSRTRLLAALAHSMATRPGGWVRQMSQGDAFDLVAQLCARYQLWTVPDSTGNPLIRAAHELSCLEPVFVPVDLAAKPYTTDWYFEHRLLQEYLVALYVSHDPEDQWQPSGVRAKAVLGSDRLLDPAWNEVASLTAGLLDSPELSDHVLAGGPDLFLERSSSAVRLLAELSDPLCRPDLLEAVLPYVIGDGDTTYVFDPVGNVTRATRRAGPLIGAWMLQHMKDPLSAPGWLHWAAAVAGSLQYADPERATHYLCSLSNPADALETLVPAVRDVLLLVEDENPWWAATLGELDRRYGYPAARSAIASLDAATKSLAEAISQEDGRAYWTAVASLGSRPGSHFDFDFGLPLEFLAYLRSMWHPRDLPPPDLDLGSVRSLSHGRGVRALASLLELSTDQLTEWLIQRGFETVDETELLLLIGKQDDCWTSSSFRERLLSAPIDDHGPAFLKLALNLRPGDEYRVRLLRRVFDEAPTPKYVGPLLINAGLIDLERHAPLGLNHLTIASLLGQDALAGSEEARLVLLGALDGPFGADAAVALGPGDALVRAALQSWGADNADNGRGWAAAVLLGDDPAVMHLQDEAFVDDPIVTATVADSADPQRAGAAAGRLTVQFEQLLARFAAAPVSRGDQLELHEYCDAVISGLWRAKGNGGIQTSLINAWIRDRSQPGHGPSRACCYSIASDGVITEMYDHSGQSVYGALQIHFDVMASRFLDEIVDPHMLLDRLLSDVAVNPQVFLSEFFTCLERMGSAEVSDVAVLKSEFPMPTLPRTAAAQSQLARWHQAALNFTDAEIVH